MAVTFTPLTQQVNAALVQERMLVMLSGFCGALALVLAGLGLYGIASYAVTSSSEDAITFTLTFYVSRPSLHLECLLKNASSCSKARSIS